MQTGGNVLNLLTVTETACLFRILAWFGDKVLVGGGLVCRCTVAVVTKNATEFAVCGLNERGIAEKNFFPRFQRGNGATSAFPLRFRRFLNLVDREFLQRFLVAMAFDTAIACRNRGG